jgi:hypothetical protein
MVQRVTLKNTPWVSPLRDAQYDLHIESGRPSRIFLKDVQIMINEVEWGHHGSKPVLTCLLHRYEDLIVKDYKKDISDTIDCAIRAKGAGMYRPEQTYPRTQSH